MPACLGSNARRPPSRNSCQVQWCRRHYNHQIKATAQRTQCQHAWAATCAGRRAGAAARSSGAGGTTTTRLRQLLKGRNASMPGQQRAPAAEQEQLPGCVGAGGTATNKKATAQRTQCQHAWAEAFPAWERRWTSLP